MLCAESIRHLKKRPGQVKQRLREFVTVTLNSDVWMNEVHISKFLGFIFALEASTPHRQQQDI